MSSVSSADVVYDVTWGDSGKGKISSFLSKRKNKNGSSYYDYVARWNGGSNAGHTVWHNNKKYATHLIPSGIFHGIKSLIGPGCVINIDSFYKEVLYLKKAGFDTTLIKVHPNAHIVTGEHIKEDKEKLGHLGTTSQGIAPAYRDKFARTGLLAKNSNLEKSYLLTEDISGKLLCEGAQGFWLDINYGNYPYITSSETLPYASCSLGFSPKRINNIFAAAKMYDTRSGEDPDFPESLLSNSELLSIADAGQEFGTTTGRRRKVNYLNLDKLIYALRIGGGNILVMSKCDILSELGIFKLFYHKELINFSSLEEMKSFIELKVKEKCIDVEEIYFSSNPEIIENFKY